MHEAWTAHVFRTILSCVAALIVATSPSFAAQASRAPAGQLPDGTLVEMVTLANGHGVSATILTYGATLQSLTGPDRNGKLADVLLGYDDLAAYLKRPDYFGGIVGRFANRIAGGKFTIDGKGHQLPLNNNGNSLHGGGKGFDRQPWKIQSLSSGAEATVVLTYSSPDGDAGYPGKLETRVTYALNESGALTISFEAEADHPTIVNLTNHAVFNLSGEGAPGGALGHLLTIPASAYTPVDAGLIPTGEIRSVAGSAFDFRKPRPVSDAVRDGTDLQISIGRGYDHNWVLDKGRTAAPELAALLEDPISGRVLEVLSTEPGLQFYSGNFLDGSFTGKHGHVYRMGDGFALEPQKFPDAPNHPNFPSARVDPGKPYRHVMVYRLSVRH